FTRKSSKVDCNKTTKFAFYVECYSDLLVIDENLAIDVVPAVENARILSTNKQLVFPTPKSTSFRASEAENIYDDMISENLPRETTRNVGRSVDAVDDDVEYEDNNIMSHMGKKRRKVEEVNGHHRNEWHYSNQFSRGKENEKEDIKWIWFLFEK
ncbi:hypothetical protein DICVIV_11204, partial [Dictyocaulus viviparus]